MAALAGCNINPANQGSVSSWFSMRRRSAQLRHRRGRLREHRQQRPVHPPDPAFPRSRLKTHAAHVTTSSYSELFSLALTPRYYELYEFEVRYLSYTVTRETGAYEERCEANGEALEKTVRKGSAASPTRR